MFSNWLLCSCFLLFLAVGDSQGNQQIESNTATLLDHEIYPHHSMMHSLLHKLQGYHPEKDLPQNWPITPRKLLYPIYYPIGYLYQSNHGPTFFVHKTGRIEKRRSPDITE
uniref:Uncharacterized protein n=1 Tax=Daphnia galeata TaxID=27404 RepID=A0A8J2WPP6_9CRUS|nr:unnamed protein product [Daphnia galeata]